MLHIIYNADLKRVCGTSCDGTEICSKQSTLPTIKQKLKLRKPHYTYTKALKISSHTTPLFVFARPNNVILTLRVIKAFE